MRIRVLLTLLIPAMIAAFPQLSCSSFWSLVLQPRRYRISISFDSHRTHKEPFVNARTDLYRNSPLANIPNAEPPTECTLQNLFIVPTSIFAVSSLSVPQSSE